MSEPYDKLGREIKAGDYVAYGHNLDRSAGLRIGRILKITEQERDWRGNRKFHFTVQGIDDDSPGKVACLLHRKGTLQFAERLIVLDASMLPDYYGALLRSCDITIKMEG